MRRRLEVALWAVSVVCLSAVMFWFNCLHRINQAPSRLSVLLWFSVGKLVACLSIAWMLYSLCVGQAGRWCPQRLRSPSLLLPLFLFRSSGRKILLAQSVSLPVTPLVRNLPAPLYPAHLSSVHGEGHLRDDRQTHGNDHTCSLPNLTPLAPSLNSFWSTSFRQPLWHRFSMSQWSGH